MGTLVIAGGAGFIGSCCAEYFAKKGSNIILIDNFSREHLLHHKFANLRFNADYLLNTYANIQLQECDLRNYEKIRPIIEMADGVIFAAGQTAVTASLLDPREDLENNLLSTFNVLESIRNSRKEIPLIYCSTNKVYGDQINRLPITEGNDTFSLRKPYHLGIPEIFSTDQCAHTPYGVSKLASDLYVQDYSQIYGLRTVAFRMSCIYGPHQFGMEDQGWVVHFIARVLQELPIKIFGNGKQVRDLLYVEDLVGLFERYLADYTRTGSGVFNIGGGPKNAVSLLQLLKILGDLTGKQLNVENLDWRSGDQKIYISNIQKAQKTLGWTPTTSVRQGLAKTVEWVSHHMKLFST